MFSLQVVPDLAAEEIVTIDSDDSSDSAELFVRAVPSVESDMFAGHTNYSDSSSDSASIRTISGILGGSDSSSMSPVQLENIDSADDHSVAITDDEDFNGMRRSNSNSNESIDPLNSLSNERSAGESAPSIEPQNHNAIEPQDTIIELSNVAVSTVSSSASVPTAIEYVTVQSTELQTRQEYSSVMPVNLDSSMDCFTVNKPKKLPKPPTESPSKSAVYAEAGEDGEVTCRHCRVI